MTESEIYVRQLLPKKHGYPLWCPKPPDDLPSEYQADGVTIGDVGAITEDGVFDRIFNIFSPAEDLALPSGFEQMTTPANVLDQEDWRSAGDYIASTRMEKTRLDLDISSPANPAMPIGLGVGFQLTSSSKEGAVLLLPDGASRHDARRRQAFREYALRHAKSWYEFVNGTRGMEVANGSLYLVTGCDKASSWGVASFSNKSREGQVSLKFTAVQAAGVSVSWDWQCEEFGSVSIRSGPKRINDDSPRPQNQCVFIRGFRVMIREGPFAALGGAVKVEHVGGNTSHRSPFSSQSFSFVRGQRSPPLGGQSQGQQSPQDSPEPSICVDDSDEAVADSMPESSPESAKLFESCDEFTVEYVPHVAEVYHPSTVINKYLLDQMPECEVSITHDDDWCAILEMDETDLPDPSEILRRISEKYQVVDCGGAYVVPKGEATLAARHQKYYLPDGNLYLLVDNCLFCVHRDIFERQSTHLREMLSDPANPGGPSRGTLESTAIVWDGIKAAEFEELLSLFYDQMHSFNNKTIEDWLAVIKLAERWHFSQVKMIALGCLEHMEMSDVDRIMLYRKIDINESNLIPSYAALCSRQAPLTPEEGLQLGLGTAIHLLQARDRARSLCKGNGNSASLSFMAGDLHSLIVDEFGLKMSLPGNAQLDIDLAQGRGNVDQVPAVESTSGIGCSDDNHVSNRPSPHPPHPDSELPGKFTDMNSKSTAVPSNQSPCPTRLLRYSSKPKVKFDVHCHPSTITSLPSYHPLSHHELSEPATNPPLRDIRIICPVFKQPILVSSSSPVGVTVGDVLSEIYCFLNHPVRAAEFYDLPSEDARNHVNSAYLRRVARNENERRAGVKRVDFLMGRSRFLGLSKTERRPETFVLKFL